MSFLQKFQRQPKMYIDLPSGGTYYDDTVVEDNQFIQMPVYAMSAMDEITTKTPDILFSGQAVCDVIQSCMPLIKDPWKLLKTDVDYILAAIKIASYGNTVELSAKCQHCNESQDFDFDLNTVLNFVDNATIEDTFDYKTLEFQLLPITYKQVTAFGLRIYHIQKQMVNSRLIEDKAEQEQIQNQLNVEYNEALIDVIIPYIRSITDSQSKENENNTEQIINFLKSNDREVLNIVTKKINEFIAATSFQDLEVQCGACQETFKVKYNGDYSNFFG